jgi:hypothetical protein
LRIDKLTNDISSSSKVAEFTKVLSLNTDGLKSPKIAYPLDFDTILYDIEEGQL